MKIEIEFTEMGKRFLEEIIEKLAQRFQSMYSKQFCCRGANNKLTPEERAYAFMEYQDGEKIVFCPHHVQKLCYINGAQLEQMGDFRTLGELKRRPDYMGMCPYVKQSR